MTKSTCLIYAISPIHAISALSAVLTRHSSAEANAIILVQWPGADMELIEELADIFATMLRQCPFVKRIVPLASTLNSEILTEKSTRKMRSRFRKAVGVGRADEVYYSHDVTGTLYQVLSTVYPRARRICFGDAMGEVFEREVHLSFLGITSDPVPPEPSAFRALLGNVFGGAMSVWKRYGGTGSDIVLRDPPPHEAVLILPVDQSGAFLEKARLTVCRRDTVIDLLNRCAGSCNELEAYIQSLLEEHRGKRRFVLLTENLAEGNFIDFEQEIKMYCRIIADYCEPGDVIYLKSHPGETLPRHERIAERLAGTYEIVEIDKRFGRYPIELWRSLVFECENISFSYPVLSLKYLYDIDVIQPMSDDFIENWFPEWTWASFKNSLSLYMEPLKRLAEWDGRSALWSGSVEKRAVAENE